MQSTISAIDTIFNSEDSAASLEIISEVSNSYDGYSCKTTTATNNGDDSTIDDEYADIPQLIDIPVAPSRITSTPQDSSEASAIGGSMEIMKEVDTIRISGCNPNGIRSDQLKSQLQHSLDLDIDIQCFSEVNADVLQPRVKQKFYEYPRSMDKSMRSVWSTSKIPSINKYKPGGTGICSNGKAAGRIKKSDKDEFGQWAYQILDGKGKKEILIISIYQCC